MKIFGIGLSKTGTTSLNEALCILGFKSEHYVFDIDKIDELDAATDLPIARIYKTLDVKYPNSKFILTTRSLEQWLISCALHFEDLPREDKILTRQLRLDMYGVEQFDKTAFESAYFRHYSDVKSYFTGRETDLLEYNISEGWEPLCKFLEKDIPDVPFPRLNTKLPPGVWDRPTWEELPKYKEFLSAYNEGGPIITILEGPGYPGYSCEEDNCAFSDCGCVAGPCTPGSFGDGTLVTLSVSATEDDGHWDCRDGTITTSTSSCEFGIISWAV